MIEKMIVDLDDNSLWGHLSDYRSDFDITASVYEFQWSQTIDEQLHV